jgi:hypothetical protein
MQRVDEKVANALVLLKGEVAFEVVKAWLTASYLRQLEGTIDLRGEEATRSQGYAEALRDILQVTKDPHKLAEKFRK